MGKEGLEYEKVKEEFYRYQRVAEEKIQQLSEANIKLEKSLDAVYNVVEVSKYVNSSLGSENLIPMINDMIVGILGVTHCAIYIVEKDKLIVKSTNGKKGDNLIMGKNYLTEECKRYMNENKAFRINSNEPINIYGNTITQRVDIYSRMGIPIKIGKKFIGYIILYHTHINFFTIDHEKFVKSISNQIAIAIENSILYREIENSAKFDPLIGIYNRKTFFEVIDKQIETKKSIGSKYAIIMIDLDNFKIVNDTLGHQFGDKVLINTGTLIKASLKAGDKIGRYGGEEIVVYIDEAENEDEVFSRVEEIRKSIELNEVKSEECSKCITASFGLSFYPKDGEKLLDIIKSADNLLYKAKNSGKNKVMSSYIFK